MITSHCSIMLIKINFHFSLLVVAPFLDHFPKRTTIDLVLSLIDSIGNIVHNLYRCGNFATKVTSFI